MLKHVIFDFDGTIADSKYITVEILNELADKYNYRKISREEQEGFRGMSIAERLKALQLSLFKIPLLAVDFNLKYRQSVNRLPLIKGIDAVIGRLRDRGLQLGIMSSNSVNNIKPFLKKEGIDVFDYVYTSGNIFGKDMAIALLLSRNGIKKEEAIYIGDECRDIEACRKNGVRIIAVSWGYDSLARLTGESPDFLLKSPSELNRLISSLM